MKESCSLLTPYILTREYRVTHKGDNAETLRLNLLKIEREFSEIAEEDLRLSLDSYSRKQGWIK